MRKWCIVLGFIVFLAAAAPMTAYQWQHPDMTQTRIFLNLLPWSLLAPLVAFAFFFVGMFTGPDP